jgi:preprotein translocase subunit SecY
MNKYQKQAILDMVKVSTIVLGAIAVVGVIIKMGMEANDLVGGLGILAMGYCIYQLFQVRVSQLESEDKRAELERKYK